MNRPTAEGTMKCPHCGADCFAAAQRCWLCYTDFGKSPEIVTAEVVAEPPRQSISEWLFAILTLLAIGMVIVVGIGVAMQEWQTGVVYLVLVSIPLAACAVRIQVKKSRQGSMTWAERFSTLMVTTLVAMGILGGLAVAAAVAFFVWCFAALGGNMNIH